MYKIKINHGKKQENINLDDSVFNTEIQKGLIKKVVGGYIFTDNYNDIIVFKIKKFMKNYERLE